MQIKKIKEIDKILFFLLLIVIIFSSNKLYLVYNDKYLNVLDIFIILVTIAYGKRIFNILLKYEPDNKLGKKQMFGLIYIVVYKLILILIIIIQYVCGIEGFIWNLIGSYIWASSVILYFSLIKYSYISKNNIVSLFYNLTGNILNLTYIFNINEIKSCKLIKSKLHIKVYKNITYTIYMEIDEYNSLLDKFNKIKGN
ncbi:hypothetical protein TPDSL_21270 [Terrisporobacter petrolearius]|uniref:hypothetical protein n=1 Tax=Terrisporobacter petrolearius TaxID=1460447 RepID=UPI003368EE42